jgi:hypothetical protein
MSVFTFEACETNANSVPTTAVQHTPLHRAQHARLPPTRERRYRTVQRPPGKGHPVALPQLPRREPLGAQPGEQFGMAH